MDEYTVEINTIPEIADSDYLDRLAEIVYEIPALVDPFLGLNANGSITASFCVAGSDPVSAASDAVHAFVQAVAEAGPLRLPTPHETQQGVEATNAFTAATVGSFGVARVDEREKVYA